jgi:GTP cyclohydrolase I
MNEELSRKYREILKGVGENPEREDSPGAFRESYNTRQEFMQLIRSSQGAVSLAGNQAHCIQLS